MIKSLEEALLEFVIYLGKRPEQAAALFDSGYLDKKSKDATYTVRAFLQEKYGNEYNISVFPKVFIDGLK